MNKKLLSLTVLTLMATTSYKAYAMFYVNGSAGVSISDVTSVKTKNKMGYTFAAGVNLPVPIVSVKAEAEISRLHSAKVDLNVGGISVDQIKYTIKGDMMNVYVGVPIIPVLPVKLYAGYGIGKSEMVREISESSGNSKEETSVKDLAQQYMLGLDVSVPLVPIAGGIEYRCMSKEFTMQGLGEKENIKLHSILGKIRYEF